MFCSTMTVASIRSLVARGGLGELIERLLAGDPVAWSIVGAVIVVSILVTIVKTKMRRDALRAAPSGDAPVIRTKGDRFIAEQAAPLLGPGETVRYQAYGLDREVKGTVRALKAKAFFAALTDERLLLFRARVGAVGPLLENLQTEAIPRSDIVGVDVEDDLNLTFIVADGSIRPLRLPLASHRFSNQAAFARDVPRLVGTRPVRQPVEAAVSR